MFRFLILSILSFSKFERIQQTSIDVSKPIPVILSLGRATLIDFPCSIVSATAGPGKDIDINVGKTNAKEIHLYLRSSNSQSTNLIVRCEKAVFVFDILPSRTGHQDYLKIDSYFGSPLYHEESGSIEIRKAEPSPSESVLDKILNLKTETVTVYNEQFGRGKVVIVGDDRYFLTTHNIIKYGVPNEVLNEFSNKYGSGVWISDSTDQRRLFISGKSMDLIFGQESQ